MKRHIFLGFTGLLVLAAICIFWGVNPTIADTKTTVNNQAGIEESQKSAYQKRQEAKQRLDRALEAGDPESVKMMLQAEASLPQQTTQTAVAAPKAASPRIKAMAVGPLAALAVPPFPDNVQPPMGINPLVDVRYPHWAYSPNIRKFVNKLPGLGWDNRNEIGQYIPVAAPNTSLYPGSDYYEIGLTEYNEKMHADLPATLLRGYHQLNTTDPNLLAPHYLGPAIIAQKDRPVRIKFVNQLATGMNGNLFLPVDTNLMGAGMGPDGMNMYTQNRSTIHLHGGLVPWISDGTPHQWVTPPGDPTPFKKGASFRNVPDMVGTGPGKVPGTAGDGMGTFYYPNGQSSRLMFYHDHAMGITRLNVYAGVAAPYLIVDQVEEDLITGSNVSGVFTAAGITPTPILPNIGGVYKYGIPLVIQDKSFVNDSTTPSAEAVAAFPAGYTPTAKTADVDPLWYYHLPMSQGGHLWLPHEYVTNENLYDPTGFWYQGRWDYGPWILPPMFPLHDTLPSPSIVPEAFMDTMVVNGCPYPYVELPPTAIRFRILNACNDRMLNLSLYKADPTRPTEVNMINPGLVDRNAFPTWPLDTRAGGVPNPAFVGPDILQIGNECGFIAQLAPLPPQPVNFDYDRTSATFGNVSDVGLFLPPAVRADIVVDFSGYQDGDILILYNDAMAPVPLYDHRYDIFTDGQDWTPKGGAPPSAPGFGPNTRTLMQIRIKGTATAAYDVNALRTVLPKAFAKGQDKIIVPATAYNDAYGTNYSNFYANVLDESLNISGTTQSVARVFAALPGFGYTTPPTVNFYGGGVGGGTPGIGGTPGVRATATATRNGVAGITLTAGGSGYTTAPTVTITPAVGDTGVNATATAIVSGGVVTTVVINNPGSNYLLAPTIGFTGGGGTLAAAVSNVTLGSVGAINVTNGGSGYIKAPYVTLTGGGGIGAVADALLTNSITLDGKMIVEGMDMEYGRMNAVLGSVPNPMTPAVGAGPIIGANFYIDPPTEILNDGQIYLWRIAHIGVDSHSLHFHLFNVQVVNRVDWTNTLLDPYPEELGWKETIRTNPFEDIIVAFRPRSMALPFTVTNSTRLLDPTMPANTIGNFQPVLPPIGIPAVAQITNVMTNFGWEYVWHCHLLGHEENDMMRPLCMVVTAPSAPTNLRHTITNTPLGVNLIWNPTGINSASFTLQRALNTGFTNSLMTFNIPGDVNTYTDTTGLAPNTTYYYRVRAVNGAGTSGWSNRRTVVTPNVPTVPGAPRNATANPGDTSATVTFLAPASNGGSAITGYTVTSNPAGGVDTAAGTTSTTHNITGLTNGTPYTFTVKATNAIGTGPASSPSNSVTPSTNPLIIYEAETATLSGAIVLSTYAGYTWTGYADYQNNSNDYVQWTVNAASAGQYQLNFRYALNTGSRSLAIRVNGVVVNAGLAFPSTGSLTTWAYVTQTVTLNAGANLIRATAIGSSGPNIDHLAVASLGPPTAPGAPTGVTATAGNTVATVTFTPPVSDGGSAITGYTVTSNPAGGVDADAGTTSTTHLITGLTNGTPYTFTVTATNGIGTGPASSPSNSVTPSNLVIYQAENATLSGAVVATSAAGFTGTGYADYINASVDYVQWTINVPTAGPYQLSWRHAFASGTRTLSVTVNGAVVNAAYAFTGTGSTSTWQTSAPQVVNLNAGANTVRLTATGTSGPNVDYLAVQ